VGRTGKAGGPEDILRFVRCEAATPLADPSRSYEHWWATRYGVTADIAGLQSEANLLRYRRVGGVLVRLAPGTTPGEREAIEQAARRTGVAAEVSLPSQTDGELAGRLPDLRVERLRALGPISDELARACHRLGIAIDSTPVTGHGRVELPCWLREQSISRTLHRHGRRPATLATAGAGTGA
jgi:RHH-type proline utilization regulon transcriptional repressor/proline dehydrogenase/delta 1-pyrroline-5-carboxylate dehydrogenase